MKIVSRILIVICVAVLFACGGGDKQDKKLKFEKKKVKVPASTRVELNNKGVGPIKSITLEKEINTDMAGGGTWHVLSTTHPHGV